MAALTGSAFFLIKISFVAAQLHSVPGRRRQRSRRGLQILGTRERNANTRDSILNASREKRKV